MSVCFLICKWTIQQAKLARSDQQKVFQLDSFWFLSIVQQGRREPFQAATALRFSWIGATTFCARFLQRIMFFNSWLIVLLPLLLLGKTKQSKSWKLLEHLLSVLCVIEWKLLLCHLSVLSYARKPTLKTSCVHIMCVFQSHTGLATMGHVLVFQSPNVRRSFYPNKKNCSVGSFLREKENNLEKK